jgi:transposase
MNKISHMVNLANGKQVPWDEFSNWSSHKQRSNLKSPADYKDWSSLHYYISLANSQRKSIESGRKKSARNSGISNGQSRAVITPFGEFQSIRAAARHYGVDISTLGNWIKNTKKDHFQYKFPLTEAQTRSIAGIPKAIHTPDGIFSTIQSAADHYGVGRQVIQTWIRSKRFGNFSYAESSEKITTSSARSVNTPDGRFISLRSAADHYGVQTGTICKWIEKGKLGFSFSN